MRLSQKAMQRRSQRDRLVKRKVFKLRNDADDIPCSITIRSAGGVSFQRTGPTTANARFWEREVREVQEDQSAADERSEQIKIRSKRSKIFDRHKRSKTIDLD